MYSCIHCSWVGENPIVISQEGYNIGERRTTTFIHRICPKCEWVVYDLKDVKMMWGLYPILYKKHGPGGKYPLLDLKTLQDYATEASHGLEKQKSFSGR